jgi:hypothetical protein
MLYYEDSDKSSFGEFICGLLYKREEDLLLLST